MAILMVAAAALSCSGSGNGSQTTTSNTAKPAVTTPSSSSSSDEGNTDPEPPGIPEGMVDVNQPFTDNFDLTAEGTIYWEYYAEVGDQKKDATDRIGDISFDGGQNHDDNKATISWTDGTTTEVMESTTNGKNATNYIDLIITDLEGCSTIKFFVGAWNSTNILTIYDAEESELGSMNLFSANGEAQIGIITIDLSKYEGGDSIGIRFFTEGSGNVSLSAIAIS